jgi:hypothetical protein
MMRRAALCLIVLYSVSAGAMPLDVNVPETIRGVSQYASYGKEVSAQPQRFLLDWENQGSVSCRVRMRIDFLEEDVKVYTGWSAEKPIEPGDHGEFVVYFYPNMSGNYTARIFAYHCNTIEELKNASFSAYVPRSEANLTGNASNASARKANATAPAAPFEIKTSNTNENVEFRVKSKTTLSELVIIPVKYPLGWIMESGKAGEIKAGEERSIDAPYVPSVWKPVEVVYEVSTLDGKYHQTVSVKLSEQKNGYSMEQVAIGLLIIAVLFLAALLMREKTKNK